MPDEEQEEQRREDLEEHLRQQREALKLYFDAFKHLSTLCVAVAVLVLAVYKEGIAEQWRLMFSLVMFGFAALLALYGMVVVPVYFRFIMMGPFGQKVHVVLLASSGLFFLGLWVLLLKAMGTTLSVVVLTSCVLFLTALVVLNVTVGRRLRQLNEGMQASRRGFWARLFGG